MNKKIKFQRSSIKELQADASGWSWQRTGGITAVSKHVVGWKLNKISNKK
jgi:hypothetical protein